MDMVTARRHCTRQLLQKCATNHHHPPQCIISPSQHANKHRRLGRVYINVDVQVHVVCVSSSSSPPQLTSFSCPPRAIAFHTQRAIARISGRPPDRPSQPISRPENRQYVTEQPGERDTDDTPATTHTRTPLTAQPPREPSPYIK